MFVKHFCFRLFPAHLRGWHTQHKLEAEENEEEQSTVRLWDQEKGALMSWANRRLFKFSLCGNIQTNFIC